MKRILSALLCVLLMVQIVPIGIFTASAATEGYYTYTVSGGKATITAVDKSIAGDISIPPTLNGYPVVVIDRQSFYNCTALTSVIIPEGVTSLGSAVFRNCSNLTNIIIPNSVTTIGTNAFYDCTNLTNIILPHSVTEIGSQAFYNCISLKSVTIPNGVTTIKSGTFSNCTNLVSVTFHNNIIRIGEDAFKECNKLNINISSLAAWCNITFDTYSSNPLTCGSKLYCNNSLVTDLVVPDGIVNIKDYSFAGYSELTSVIISNSVTSIGFKTFIGCSNLTSVIIGDSVTNITDYAFYNCDNLTSIVIPNSIKTIGEWSFPSSSSHTEIFYSGNQTDRSNINIASYNTALTDATWHYNVSPSTCNGHNYDDCLDGVCNKCGFIRPELHTYDSIYDTTCNDCGAIREAEAFGDVSSVFAQLQNGISASSQVASIRFVAAIEDRLTDFDQAGFVFSLSNHEPTVGGTNCTVKGTNTVYTAIMAGGEKIPASKLGGTYVFALSLNNIPNGNFGTDIYVRSYVLKKDGSYSYSDVKSYSVSSMLGGESA